MGRVHHYQASCKVRKVGGKAESHHRTDVMAYDVDLRISVCLRQFQDVRSHLLFLVSPWRSLARPHPSEIDRIDAIMFAQGDHDLVKRPPRLRPSWKEEHWITASAHNVVKPHTID